MRDFFSQHFRLGSGAATHNLGALWSGKENASWAIEFLNWLTKTVTGSDSPTELRQNLVNWAKAPHAKQAHPREEHLIPIHVVAGACGGKNAKVIYDKLVAALSFASFKWD